MRILYNESNTCFHKINTNDTTSTSFNPLETGTTHFNPVLYYHHECSSTEEIILHDFPEFLENLEE